jgi:hypothetical protein
MMVTSIDQAVSLTQDDVFDILQEYLQWALASAIMNLTVAVKGRVDGSMTADDIDLSTISGLRYVGSIFHILDDTSAFCGDAAVRHVNICIPGDGHTMATVTSTGQMQVVALSDNAYYERRTRKGESPHGPLDDLYREELIQEVYGTFDPALVSGPLLAEVARAVRDILAEVESVPLFLQDGAPNDAFDTQVFHSSVQRAGDIYDALIADRFAATEDRVPLPPLAPNGEDGKADGFGSGEAGSAGAAGCTVAPARTPEAPIVALAFVLIVLPLARLRIRAR